MIWPTNYQKLATATLFTLFFGGNVFAPKLKAPDGKTSVQDFLQDHYCNAFAELAKRIQKAPGLEDDVVIGYDTLNEPSHGWIGVHDLNQFPESQEMKQGEVPTPFQCMLLGSGIACDVERWEMTSVGPTKKGMLHLDPKGESAWLPEFPMSAPTGPGFVTPNASRRKCIWAQHGIWDIESRKLLKPDYFAKHPETGVKLDFLVDFWKPFVRKITHAIRQVHSTAVMFIEPPVNDQPPIWSAEDGDPTYRIAYAPHWYDGLTLVSKHFNRWFSVDYLGFKRGQYSNIAFAVKLGESGIRTCFKNQLGLMRREGLEYLGQHPCIMGEIGIPYDMDNKVAYTTGDYSAQEKALDTNMRAIESTLINCTLWNYVADNNHAWGDGWNGEDLSLFSRILPNKKKGVTGASKSFKRDPLPSGAGTVTVSEVDSALESKTGSSHYMNVIAKVHPEPGNVASAQRTPDTLTEQDEHSASSHGGTHNGVSSRTPLMPGHGHKHNGDDADELTDDSVEAIEDANPASPPDVAVIGKFEKPKAPSIAASSTVSSALEDKILIPPDEKELDIGGRALNAFTRPYPVLTPGTPLQVHFDMNSATFTYTFSHPVVRKPVVKRKSKKSKKADVTPLQGDSIEPLKTEPSNTIQKRASMIMDSLKLKSSTPDPRQRFSWLHHHQSHHHHHHHHQSIPSLFSHPNFQQPPTSASNLLSHPENLATETEIYIPSVHYPSQKDLEVWVSEGRFRLELVDQRLHWRCGCFDKLRETLEQEGEGDEEDGEEGLTENEDTTGEEGDVSNEDGDEVMSDGEGKALTEEEMVYHTIVFRRKKAGQEPLELFGRQKRKEAKQERSMTLGDELAEGARVCPTGCSVM
jgi:hypothetical protein